MQRIPFVPTTKTDYMRIYMRNRRADARAEKTALDHGPTNFYVYAHVDTSGEMVYIGKGTGPRAWNASSSSRQNPEHLTWLKAQSDMLDVVHILERSLSATAAYAREAVLIQKHRPRFNRHHRVA